MTRQTIDFGIDLGTTNSCIALVKGTEIEVIRNNEGFDTTPSAVGIDRKGRLHVGRAAKEQFEADEENAAIEFKLQMGKDAPKHFVRGGQKLKPEELSAEVLKSLLGDVRQRMGETPEAAVITVPADFDLPQCDATRRAAQQAGLRFSPLLQEPIAAALAYGYQSSSNKVFWMVYDLGGGTFDAAVIQMRDGLFRVVNHGGDRHLGGKLIDWAIVDELLVPALTSEYKLQDFHRGNSRWRAAFAKLKLAAEKAKIRLSRDASTSISIEFPDERGQLVQFDYDLQKSDLEHLIEPFVLRTINICKKALSEKRLGPGDVEKLLLVGGPTLTPYLRDRLTDKAQGLGIPLEFRLDPMTVVAAGAAVFAGSQRLESSAPAAVVSGQYPVQLEYQPVGADPEPLVGGKVSGPEGSNLTGFSIEFVDNDSRPPRRSGKLRLAANGSFMTNLWAEKGRPNVYLIELCDATGRQCPTAPDRLSYLLGNVSTDPPLIHSLGVAMANNEMDMVIPKGTALPARKRVVHRTAVGLHRGQAAEVIRIVVVEGENRRADRNRLIGALEINGERIKRDIPAGSEIEITVEMDQSRLLKTKAYVPILDEEYEHVIKFNRSEVDLAHLKREVDRERKRLLETRRKSQDVTDSRARKVLERIDQERIEQDLTAALAAAGNDPDAADKCQNRLLDLRSAVDEVDDALRWPALIVEAEEEITRMKDLVREHGKEPDRKLAQTLERETRQAMDTRDADLLQRKVKAVSGLCYRLLFEQPGFWVGWLNHLEDRRESMRDNGTADQLFRRARQAMNENDLAGLRAAVQQLVSLLPADQQAPISGYGGTTLR